MVLLTPALLARHDHPVPRYTSYPTALEFDDGYGPDEHDAQLRRAGTRSGEPLGLYIHIPFCRSRCSFCACHVVVTSSPSLAVRYVRTVLAEAALVADRLDQRRRLQQLHLGGGTPTHLTPDELVALHDGLLAHFTLGPDAELSIEVDPRVTSSEHLTVLRGLGFDRLSMGVQDVDAEVQRLIGRDQLWGATVELYGVARSLGFDSINLDLIYGLPGQTYRSFDHTLAEVTRLRPDRIALYSFALVPWTATQQRRLWTDLLPPRDTKAALCTTAHQALTDAGYVAIGMDHFALPSDELAIAAREHRLSRTFMGYTAVRAPEIVALGTSGISELADAYGQDHKRLATYLTEVDDGRLPTERGVVLTAEDKLRRHVIRELMCNGRVSARDVAERFGVELAQHFGPELAAMGEPGSAIAEGLAVVDDDGIEATDVGRFFVRNIASAFDAYRAGPHAATAFSKSV